MSRVTTDGRPAEDADLNIDPRTGQQHDYIVLSADERTRGFVRPLRDKYKHDACGHVTVISQSIAETYACNPAFYGATFCVYCRTHFPVGEDGEFHWCGTDIKVGT